MTANQHEALNQAAIHLARASLLIAQMDAHESTHHALEEAQQQTRLADAYIKTALQPPTPPHK
jgi:hypothetical protein